jgi:hypothetical protein
MGTLLTMKMGRMMQPAYILESQRTGRPAVWGISCRLRAMGTRNVNQRKHKTKQKHKQKRGEIRRGLVVRVHILIRWVTIWLVRYVPLHEVNHSDHSFAFWMGVCWWWRVVRVVRCQAK